VAKSFRNQHHHDALERRGPLGRRRGVLEHTRLNDTAIGRFPVPLVSRQRNPSRQRTKRPPGQLWPGPQ